MSEQRRVIVLTGVPGVGKTTVSRFVAEKLGCPLIDVSSLAQEEGLITGADEERETSIVDLEMLTERLAALLERHETPMVVEGHYAYDAVPPELVSHAFVLRKAPWRLREELAARGYAEEKVRENVEAELVDVCLVEAVEALGPELVCEIDATDRPPAEVAEEILSIVQGRGPCRRGEIDWLAHPESRGLLEGRGECT